MARPNKDNILVNSLSPNELAELIAISVKKVKPNFTTEMAKLSIRAFTEIMADELKNNGYFNIPNIGTFKTMTCGGEVKRMYNFATNKKENIMIPLTYVARFKSAEYLKGYLNNIQPSLKTKSKANAKMKEMASPEFQRKAMLDKQKRVKNEKKLAEMLEPDIVEYNVRKKGK